MEVFQKIGTCCEAHNLQVVLGLEIQNNLPDNVEEECTSLPHCSDISKPTQNTCKQNLTSFTCMECRADRRYAVLDMMILASGYKLLQVGTGTPQQQGENAARISRDTTLQPAGKQLLTFPAGVMTQFASSWSWLTLVQESVTKPTPSHL